MIALIVSFLSGTLGRIAVGGLVFFAAWGFVKFHYEGKGAAKERAKIEHAGNVNASKSAKIRAKVGTLPAEKLVDRYTRD